MVPFGLDVTVVSRHWQSMLYFSGVEELPTLT
jgi:hypothetical protein